MPSRNVKNLGKALLRKGLEVGQVAGFDVLPRHFYSEIPDIRLLKKENSWRRARSMNGIAGAGVDEQMSFVEASVAPFREQLSGASLHANASDMNGEPGYGAIEAEFLYAFIRSVKPPSVVQVGCGVSTAVMLMAALDAGYSPVITCIEPYPTKFLRQAASKGRLRLVKEKFQETTFDVAGAVGTEGLFFVDSSHTLGPAGEVNHLILEALPTLQRGAWAHFHDITFPYDYSPYVLSTDLFFQHETALLYGFLVNNARFRIAASLSMLNHYRQSELKRAFRGFEPAVFEDGVMIREGQYPSSIYLKVEA